MPWPAPRGPVPWKPVVHDGEVRDEEDLADWDLPGFDDWLSGRADATRRAYVE